MNTLLTAEIDLVLTLKKKINVYLAGPMEGVTKEHMKGWRDQAKEFFRNRSDDVNPLDPTRREPFHQADGANYARLLFRADLADIDSSSAIVVDARRSSGKAAGTNMEMMYAWQKGIPLFLWVDPEDPPHPFYISMATTISLTLQDTLEFTAQFLEI
jgi:nucleoside 2-deoxyribosyltransferase